MEYYTPFDKLVHCNNMHITKIDGKPYVRAAMEEPESSSEIELSSKRKRDRQEAIADLEFQGLMLALEKEKLAIENRKLIIEKDKLAIEKEKLAIENGKFQLEKNRSEHKKHKSSAT